MMNVIGINRTVLLPVPVGPIKLRGQAWELPTLELKETRTQ
jgi:hypothetical protein